MPRRKKTEDPIRFDINPTQRLILAEIEKAEKEGRTPRFVIWKNRCQGPSASTILTEENLRRWDELRKLIK